MATTAFRRLDATVASRDLAEATQAHLRLIQRVASQAPDASHKARMAAVGSEAASLVGWLAWDMADHGSARTWYGSAIKAARTAGDPLPATHCWRPTRPAPSPSSKSRQATPQKGCA